MVGISLSFCCLFVWNLIVVRLNFVLLFCFQVKVENWANGKAGDTFVGVNARFGSLLPTHSKDFVKSPAVFTNPLNGCSASSTKVRHCFSFNFLAQQL